MPRFTSCTSSRHFGRPSARKPSISARVLSVEPSSTTTSSSTSGYSSSSTAATIGSSLYAGTTAMRRGAGVVHEAASCSRYQSRVLRRPSANVCFGSQPSSSRARSLLTTTGAVVARTRGTEGHLDVADQVAHGLGQPADRDRLVGLEVVRAVLRGRLQREHVRGRKVFDVDEASLLRAVAVDAQRLTAHRAQQERGDDEIAAHARTEGNAVAQHGVRTTEQRCVVAAEHLGRDLLRHVEVAIGLQVEPRVLVDLVAVRRGVHPDGARHDHAPGVGAPSGLEHPRDAERVERDALGRVGDDVVDVGHRGEVEHGVRALRARR